MGLGGYLTYGEAAAELGVQAGYVRRLVRQGRLEGVSVCGVAHVTPESVRLRAESSPGAGRPPGPHPRGVPEGYVPSGEAARALGVPSQRISGLVADGLLAGKKVGGRLFVERGSLEARLAGGPRRRGRAGLAEVGGGYMKLTDAARELGISKGRLSALVSSGAVAARKEGKFTLVPVSEVERRRACNPGPGRPKGAARGKGAPDR